ncbi:MAG: orotidine-5'-phosphate decarboxylase [Firmicutes bacterium]|jgi:orotidine-5'-phosphate decarboxylase|nr:orotidine-5'-phosphate decarboxylase [Bacillota bacterium]
MQAKERIILALDVDTEDEAMTLVEKLRGHVGAFKVGMQLYTAVGPDVVRRIQNLGGSVFVDLKFHDIPNTVASAGRVMTRLGCAMFTTHAAGGTPMLSALAQAVKDEAATLGVEPPLVLAVTVLTSIDQRILEEDLLIGGMSVKDVAVRWAHLAEAAGAGGVICSPLETAAIRAACGPRFKLVTPGIRPRWAAKNDQRRITTPGEAVKLGADYIVVGRAITQADDPVSAARRIGEEIEQAEGELGVK